MKTKIALIMGGVSVEHEISVISALQAYHALDKNKYDVSLVYISKGGEMYVGEALADISNFENIDALVRGLTQVALVRKNGGAYLCQVGGTGLFKKPYEERFDVAFPVVHGTNCEDGTVAGILESVRVPYVGCDILGSALGMDKAVMKQVLEAESLPIVPYTMFYARNMVKDEAEIVAKCEALSYPLIVKPANLGSSVGIRKVNNRDELLDAIAFASDFALAIVVEKAVAPLREINCAVLGDYSRTEASALEEPVQNDEILSYTDKYVNGGKKSGGMSSLKRKTPDDLSAEKQAEIKDIAQKAFVALHASGVARIDFLMDAEQNVFVNEINTIPGSLSFYLWEPTGKSFSQLCDDLVELALKRARERDSLVFSFDKNIFALQGTKGITGKK